MFAAPATFQMAPREVGGGNTDRVIRVLVLEDSPPDAELMLRAIRDGGFSGEVTVVDNEEHFVSRLAPDVDVILADFRLPGFTALDAFKKLRLRGLEIPFVVVTGALGDETAAECLRQGVDDYVLKDQLARLGPAVAAALDRRRLRSAEREAARKLRESEERFREFAAAIHEFFFLLDPETMTMLYASPGYERISGRTCESLYEHPLSFAELFHADDRERFLSNLFGLSEREAVFEGRIVRDDGAIRWVRTRLFPARDERGEVVRAAGIAEDVTDLKEARAAKERLAAIVESTNDAIIAKTLDGVVSSWNCAAERLYGYSAEEMIGQVVCRIIPPELVHEMSEICERIARGESVAQYETERLRKDGTRVAVSLTASPIRNETERITGVSIIARDVTARKRAEEELRAALARAQESDRLKAAFLANVSHEVRTPLNIILGYSAIIAERLADFGDPTLGECLQAIEKGSRRLLQTIQGILDLSRLETGIFEARPTTIDVIAVVREAVRRHEEAARRRQLSICCEIEVGDAEVCVDEYSFNQSLHHLLDNAIKFTEQGRVTVRLRRDAGGVLCLDVEDSGVGIDPEYFPHLFEPFSQEQVGYTRRFEGSGIGLALVKRYVELNRGEICVRSEKGRGTTVTIRFPPLPGSAAPASRGGGEAVAAEPRSGIRPVVLVVEDDELSQEYVGRILQHEFDTLYAASAAEARAHLATHPEVALVLMDLALKGDEDGLALTRWLRNIPYWKNVPVLATTAYASVADQRAAATAGCDAHLGKPFSPAELLGAVHRLVNESSSRSP